MDHYHLLEAVHIIADISWMCGMLYLPRLMIYHMKVEVSDSSYQIFCLMEKRLLQYITIPASILSIITGIFLAILGNVYHEKWFMTKVLMVITILVLQVYFAILIGKFKTANNIIKDCRLRILNELVTISMVIIVFMVTMKPF